MEGRLPKGIFISGTDTEVGKTVVTAALACCLQKSGLNVKAVKPFQTGTELEGLLDIEFVYKLLETGFDLDEVCPVRLGKPLSPHAAAALENKELDVDKVVKSLKQKFMHSEDTVLFEGAGGLLVPITKDYFMSDFARDMGLSLVIVSRPGLGTLNHTLLSIEHAKSAGLEILGVVVSNYPKNPGLAESLNIAALKELTDVDVIGVIPSIDGLDVQKGTSGNLAENCSDFFINAVGGKLNLNNFLT